MNRIIMWFIAFFVLLACFQQPAYPELYCKIRGRVLDAETKEGVPDVYVRAHLDRHDSPKNYYVFTDNEGYFTFSNLIPGLYKLSYNPLFPYVAFPDNEYFRSRDDDLFMMNKGEIKQVIQKLEKGGEIIVNSKLSGEDKSKYKESEFFLDRIEENGKIRINIQTISHRIQNPRFIRAPEGWKHSGLAPGEYILCRGFRKYFNYYTGDDHDYAGAITRFTLEKLESKIINIDYNSTSKITLDIKDEDGNTFNRGSIKIYKEMELLGKKVFYSVWGGRSYDPTLPLKPIIFEPGTYLFIILPCDMLSQDGEEIDYHCKSNYFFKNISVNDSKSLIFIVSIDGKTIASVDDFKYIH